MANHVLNSAILGVRSEKDDYRIIGTFSVSQSVADMLPITSLQAVRNQATRLLKVVGPRICDLHFYRNTLASNEEKSFLPLFSSTKMR